MFLKSFYKYGYILILLLIGLFAYIAFKNCDFKFNKAYYSSDFNIKIISSSKDYDNDGINDYKDILDGAKKYLKMDHTYKSNYYDGGYPTDNYAVCTDIIWYSLKNAGYDFKKMIDDDILINKEKYNIETPDNNIDFRRVKNIKVFLDNYAENETKEVYDIKNWQPGDIVVFKKHIAIISDKRNKDGIPYILHIDKRMKGEEDKLLDYEIEGHYRFNIKMEEK